MGLLFATSGLNDQACRESSATDLSMTHTTMGVSISFRYLVAPYRSRIASAQCDGILIPSLNRADGMMAVAHVADLFQLEEYSPQAVQPSRDHPRHCRHKPGGRPATISLFPRARDLRRLPQYVLARYRQRASACPKNLGLPNRSRCSRIFLRGSQLPYTIKLRVFPADRAWGRFCFIQSRAYASDHVFFRYRAQIRAGWPACR